MTGAIEREAPPGATAVLAHKMVELDFQIQTARDAQYFATVEHLERLRDDIRHERSLLMRQLWRYGQRP